ncbi:hypothetical protein BC937DRAFT_91745 [Endogone sp. FLAS-F59071]|nr:hypothetical protein BC937DRAFT_91745 [Endogone sp. FLAS-F59071]|eukprot:RUS15972.1 hypothetical protein BC937DRAFT_91745 [Endogone sp. FLAS-F59071]
MPAHTLLPYTLLPLFPLTKATFPRLLALCPNPLTAKRYTTAAPPPSVTFDNLTLDLFRARLADPNVGPQVRFKYADNVKEAAILVPLCVVDGKASVLFTLRSGNMRSHKGEISLVPSDHNMFWPSISSRPSKKKFNLAIYPILDPEDPTLLSTALRETQEEISLPSSAIDILGESQPVPDKSRTLRVHPFVGFVRDPVILQSVVFNPSEVQRVFAIDMDHLLNPANRKMIKFRDSKIMYPSIKTPEDLGIDGDVWGLTAFVLDGR